MELLILEKIPTPPPMSDPLLPPRNDTDSPIVLSETETKLNVVPFPPADDHADILKSPPLLTRNSTPTIVTTPLLRNDDEPDVKRNNLPSPSDDTPVLSTKRATSTTISRTNCNYNRPSSTI